MFCDSKSGHHILPALRMAFPQLLFIFVFLNPSNTVSATTGFSNNPGTVSVHENQDSVFVVWAAIQGTCTRQYTVTESRTCYTSGCTDDWACVVLCCNILGAFCCEARYYDCDQTYYEETTCDSCELSTNPSNLFTISGMQVSKKACSTPGCGPTCSASGCINAAESYIVGVTCHHSSYSSSTITTTFTVSITQNAAPTFTFRDGDSVSVQQSSAIGYVFNKMQASDSDTSYDGITTIYYTLSSGPGSSWIHNNVLFTLDTTNGNIYVTRSLALEFSWTYSMQLCVHDRRQDTSCNTLAITLYACFQTPNCTDQTNLNIVDTHGTYSGHGTTNTLFTMIYPQPSYHFPNFQSGWNLPMQWSLSSSNLDIAAITPTTGEVYITSNFSIWPAFPTKDYTMVVNVKNDGSCYETQCTMLIRVTYTNWPIEIRSLPASTPVHEDTDSKTLLHDLIVYDYNYVQEDNVTCSIVGYNPSTDVTNLFALEHNYNSVENYTWNSWHLYKLRCQSPDCGYKYASPVGYLCDRNIGCLNHDLTASYAITIQCLDAYGSTASSTFTMTVIDNAVPVWSNLPKTIVLDSDKLADLDTIFNIMYTDGELESLIYEYVYGPTNYGWFLGSTSGNYYNNLGNITMTLHQWNLTGNHTYTANICGHERRNEICEDLTIHIREYCGAVPECTEASNSVDETFAVGGTLFTVASLVQAPSNGVAFTGLSYSMASGYPGYFTMDSSGVITTIATLPAVYPSTSYSMNAFVYDSNACAYGHCKLTVTVTPVNYPIAINSLPATVSIHEDVTAETIQWVVTTTDLNSDDTVHCNITTVTPTPVSNPDLFFMTETYIGSEVYMIVSRENPGFTSATTQYTINIKCFDSQLTSATGALTLDITLNIAPTLTNLDGAVTVNQATIFNGTTIFTVGVSDTENDVITYTCSVANTMVPLECVAGTGTIQLRRNVNIVSENNVAYTIDVCIGDTKHPSCACGTLTVTFTSSRTHPAFSNLPDSVTFAENIAVGTTLFDVSVTDPDVGDSHTIYMYSVEPSSARNMFAIDRSTGILTSLLAFDYEGDTISYTITFSVADQNLVGLEKKSLTISITNVNERPTLSTGTMTITFPETTAINTVLQGPEFNCTDPDGSTDTLTYTITSGTQAAYFSMAASTGIISLAATWDLETSLPSSTAIVFSCADVAGLSSTAAITIAITDVNEFAPEVVVTYTAGQAKILLYGNTTVLDDLLTITATDQDHNDDCQFTFTILGEGKGVQYFTMDTRTVGSGATSCTSTSALRLHQKISLGYDLEFNFTIKVSDGETSELFTGVGVYAYYYASDPEIIGPTTKCILCSTNGIMFVTFLCVEAVIIVGIVLHLVVHFCCNVGAAKGDPIERFRSRKNDKDYEISSDDESNTSNDGEENVIDKVQNISNLRSRVRHEPARTAFSPQLPISPTNVVLSSVPRGPARTAFSPQSMPVYPRETTPSMPGSSGYGSRTTAVSPNFLSVYTPESLPGASLDF